MWSKGDSYMFMLSYLETDLRVTKSGVLILDVWVLISSVSNVV